MNSNNAIIVDPKKQMRETYDMLKSKLETYKDIDDARNLTNGKFYWIDNGNTNGIHLNIHVEKDQKELIKVLSFLIARKESYDKAIKLIDLNEAPVFTWCQYNFDAWLHDIKLRVQLINSGKEIKLIKNQMSILEKYFDEEDQLKNDLESIMKAWSK